MHFIDNLLFKLYRKQTYRLVISKSSIVDSPVKDIQAIGRIAKVATKRFS